MTRRLPLSVTRPVRVESNLMHQTVSSAGTGSRVKRYGLLFLALLSVAGAVWRALAALHHYRASLAAANDPSIQELEQVNTLLEGSFSIILLIHGAVFFALSRRRLQISWQFALSVALMCAFVVSGSLLGLPIITLPGLYPVTIVASVLLLSHYLEFGWLSLYLGALFGSAIGCYFGAPLTDAFVCLAVVGPCVALAFLGASLNRLYLRIVASSSST